VRPAARHWALLLGVAVLVVVLVGGRWLALETAERAWAASIPGGGAYVTARDFARLVSGLLLLGAVAWGTANLLFVYRSIGSMQLSRRLGDLEIVEAVPQPLLLAGTIASGVVFGFLLTLGTGDWWIPAALASRAPTFGINDPILHRDLGYYVAELPWMERLHGFALLAVCAATAVVTLLYVGIGSLRFRRWLPYANAHARAHVGLLLALLALTLTWGALLDPAETIAGLNGVLTQRALDLRLPAARVVAAIGVGTVIASCVWGARERPMVLVTAWGSLLAASLLGFTVIPSPLPEPGATAATTSSVRDTAIAAAQRRFEELAFGAGGAGGAAGPGGPGGPVADRAPPSFSGPDVAAAMVPLWDAHRVLVAAGARRDLGGGSRGMPAAAALAPTPGGDGHPNWLVAFRPVADSSGSRPPPDWAALHRDARARTGPPVIAVEDDTLLAFSRLATRDSTAWFGPGYAEFAVAAPDTWPALRRSGVRLAGWWRRIALAWALQSASLARRETDGLVLLWRRDVVERLQRLAPFASFDDPVPIVADGALLWLTYGYPAAEPFPLARPVEVDGRWVRYLRAGLVATVNGASGDTRLYLAPGADSLASAWSRLLEPLIRPLDSLPSHVRAQLPFPARAFRAATALVSTWHAEPPPWTPRPREPFELIAPAGDGPGVAVWMAQGFEAGSAFVALVSGAMIRGEPRVFVWRPLPPVHLPPGLLGSPNTTAPGVLRLWNVGGALFSKQALFAEPAGGPPSGIDTVFLTWGERRGQGRDAAVALRDLLGVAGGPRLGEDTSLAARWQRAQRLAAQADAALAAGDLEAFGRLYRQLQELLGRGGGRRKLAPTLERR
jgi:Uncharacterised protein family (UPF0182)